MRYWFLALAALAVVGVIAAQNIVNPTFRSETVSQGLNGPDHVWLDIAFGFLAIALVWAAWGGGALEGAAAVTALGLVGISVTNTAWRWVDGLTGRLGGHEPVHLAFTMIVFAGALAFQVVADILGHWELAPLTTASVAVPASVFALWRRQDYAEKSGVAFMCLWLIAWALQT